MKNDHNPQPFAERRAIVKMIAENRERVLPNLHAIWDSMVTDTLAAGLPERAVVESLFTVALAHTIRLKGINSVEGLLLEVRNVCAGVEAAGVDAPRRH